MSDSEKRFFAELLAEYPRLAEFWDGERLIFHVAAAEAALEVLSSGEALVLRALAAIWMGNAGEKFSLDFTELARLSPEWRMPLVEWLLNPFFP